MQGMRHETAPESGEKEWTVARKRSTFHFNFDALLY